jgi:hypothetical protein
MPEIFIDGKNIKLTGMPKPSGDPLDQTDTRIVSIRSRIGQEILDQLGNAYGITHKRAIKGLRDESMEL